MNTSLEKPRTDGVGLYFLHAQESPNVVELLHLAARTPWVESVVFRYNFRKYGDEKPNDAIEACVKADVGSIATKPQGSEASFRDAWKKFEPTGKWPKRQVVLKAVWEDDRSAAPPRWSKRPTCRCR